MLGVCHVMRPIYKVLTVLRRKRSKWYWPWPSSADDLTRTIDRHSSLKMVHKVRDVRT